jgi:hypothetical protein
MMRSTRSRIRLISKKPGEDLNEKAGTSLRFQLETWHSGSRFFCAQFHGRVAQLGERLVRNEEVGGSSPPTSTSFPCTVAVEGASVEITAEKFTVALSAARFQFGIACEIRIRSFV